MNTDKILEYATKIVELAKEYKETQCACGENAKSKTLGEYAPGDAFDADGIKMLVLDVSEDGQALCVTKDLYAKYIKFGDSTQYEGSNVEDAVKEFEQHIVQCFGENSLVEHNTKIVTVDGQEVGSYTGKTRLLTFEEGRTYNHLLVNENIPNGYWLMNPWSTPDRGWEYSVACALPAGIIFDYRYGSNYGVRPVCILKSSILIS